MAGLSSLLRKAIRDVAARSEQRGITALHSSPFDFEQFNLNNIGKGEGSQAFAHGLYFTDSKPISDFYREMFAKRGVTPKTYEVNLDVAPDEIADWDKPLSQQSRKIQNAFAELYGMDRRELMQGQKPQPKGPEESQMLAARGVKGVVFDAGSFFGAPEGARNYVMFDPATVEILRKYGLIGMLGGGGVGGALSLREALANQMLDQRQAA